MATPKTKDDQFSLEDLHPIFLKHSIAARKGHDKLIKDFQKNYPETPFPPHFTDFFDLPLALATMCKEILELKKFKGVNGQD